MSLGALVVLGAIVAVSLAMLWVVLWILPKRHSEQQDSLLKVFGTAVELRFPQHEGLTERVAFLSVQIGRELGLAPKELRKLEQAARLRDIGLCAIPWKLINEKHPTLWTPAERATYDRHSEVSGAMLELVPSLRELAPIVRHHHASKDLSRVPLASRIIAVADAVALQERELGSEGVTAYLSAQSHGFDSDVVAACLRVLPSPCAVETRFAVR